MSLLHTRPSPKSIALEAPAQPSTWPLEILLVDGDPGNIFVARETFADGKLVNRLHIAEDGEKALSFLRREGAYSSAPIPDIILLDLNMPRKGGREVLAELKTDPTLAKIPVAILTSSEDEGKILGAYNLGVDCYITKPLDLHKLMIVICSIPHFQVALVTTKPAL